MERFDAIVIGSGIGGMCAALELCNHGKSVLVLEAGLDFGGYTNPFKRKKFHFDPGVHYLGELASGQSFHETLRRLKVLDRVEFDRINDDCYDRYVFPELDFRMPASRKKFRERLLTHFPENADGIEKFMAILKALKQDIYEEDRTKKANPFALIKEIDPALTNFRKITFGQVLDQLFGDAPLLKAVLSGPCGDLGLPPGRAAATALFGIHNHYIEGAFFPHGGSGALRDSLVDAIKERGGVLKNRAAVEKIQVVDGRARSVITEAGQEFQGTVIISAIDPFLTFGKLLEDPAAEKTQKRVARLENSYASICLFVGSDVPPENIALNDENIWHYPHTDIDAIYKNLNDPLAGGDFSFFLSSPSRKDKSGKKCPEGSSVLEMVLLAEYEPWKKWADLPAMKRGQDYVDKKEELADRLIQRLEETYVKDLGKHIIVREVSTPVTNTYYTRAHNGAIYGPAHTPEQFGPNRLLPRASVKGLYLAGAAVFSCGIAPCAISGFFAATLALKETG